MSKTINATLAAVVLATSVITGASAAFAGGDYYPGVSDTPIFQGHAKAGSGATSSPTMAVTAPTTRAYRVIRSTMSPPARS